MATRRPPDSPRNTATDLSKKRTRPRAAPAARSFAASAPRAAAVSHELRRAMIAEAAYLRAEERGFVSGNELEDWLVAEREVDALLSAHHGAAPQ
jgi:hypothetical protein